MRVVRCLVVLASCAVVGCRGGSRGPGGIKGQVLAADGRLDVPCAVEVNSVRAPFSAPDVIEARTGHPFRWNCSGEPLDGVYVAARCQGYATTVASGLSVRCNSMLDIGDITVRATGQ